ncbi:DUF2624 domain-containing protein [Oceanobacillus saliphilus]|uniref:DUF2624 domain-containing protein n=1 Tax=Oceanobacillus saliphilus TaxID=2925834 RepID=UPI00201DFCFC|nr:DUF2624 domain-containing protein [Oceanobacillus saliphilus]
MSIFIKEMVKNKLKNLRPSELLQYSRQYGFQITEKQAREITDYLRVNSPDPFDANTRHEMLKQLAAITDKETALQTQKLFDEIINSYGLGYLFH